MSMAEGAIDVFSWTDPVRSTDGVGQPERVDLDDRSRPSLELFVDVRRQRPVHDELLDLAPYSPSRSAIGGLKNVHWSPSKWTAAHNASIALGSYPRPWSNSIQRSA